MNIDVRYSKDGGHTWSNWRTLRAGGTGRFMRVLSSMRWGIARQWIFHFRVTDPAGSDILGLSIDVEGYDK